MIGLELIIPFLAFFRVAFVGDPQVDNEMELRYARESVYSELQSRKDLDLVIVLGDLVNENEDLIAPSERILDSLSCPWFRVNGNHDGSNRAKDTVITLGHFRFVLLDNVRNTSKGYEGGFSKEQISLLENTSTECGNNEAEIICFHIPLSQCKGRDSVLYALRSCNRVLEVSGHTHRVKRHYISYGIEEVQAGASCGSWWRGQKDDKGIPYALMNCGAPRGYFLADFKDCADNWYKLSYKAVGRDDYVSSYLREGKLVVNVYGGSQSGEVRIKAGRFRAALDHLERIAPEVEDVIESNAIAPKAYRRAHKEEFIPMRRLKSSHVWETEAPGVEVGDRIKVIYSDPTMSFKQKVTVRK